MVLVYPYHEDDEDEMNEGSQMEPMVKLDHGFPNTFYKLAIVSKPTDEVVV